MAELIKFLPTYDELSSHELIRNGFDCLAVLRAIQKKHAWTRTDDSTYEVSGDIFEVVDCRLLGIALSSASQDRRDYIGDTIKYRGRPEWLDKDGRVTLYNMSFDCHGDDHRFYQMIIRLKIIPALECGASGFLFHSE